MRIFDDWEGVLGRKEGIKADLLCQQPNRIFDHICTCQLSISQIWKIKNRLPKPTRKQ